MVYRRPDLDDGALVKGRVDDYRIARRSGEVLKGGANGLVHRAVAMKSGKAVALKLLSPRDQKSEDELETTRRLFKNEIRKTHLVTHWNVVQIRDWGELTWERSPVPFMVMDLARENLQEYLQKGVGLLAGLLYCALLSEAVDYVNSRGLIHRDIKPENVLMTEDNGVQLSDLGIAEFRTDFEKDQFEIHGGYSEPSSDTQHPRFYFSPEQLKRAEGEKGVDLSRSDIFQLGLLFHRIVLGHPVRGQIQQKRSTYGDLLPLIRNTFWEMIQDDPRTRPPLHFCATVLWVALEHLLSRLYAQADQVDPYIRAALIVCFHEGNRLPLRVGESSRWDLAFSWLNGQGLLRFDQSGDAVLTARGIALKDLVLGTHGWHNFIRLYSLVGRRPALSINELIRELKVGPKLDPAIILGRIPSAGTVHCKMRKSTIAVLPPFQYRGSYWVEIHAIHHERAPTVPMAAPLFVGCGKTRRGSLLRICSELKKDGLSTSARKRLLCSFKDNGTIFSITGVRHLLADVVGALCCQKPTNISIKWHAPAQGGVLNIERRRHAVPRGLVEFEFTHLVDILIQGNIKELEALFRTRPEVCLVPREYINEFLMMLVRFTGRLDQQFCVAPAQDNWRLYFLRFGFLGFERRRVANFLRAWEETKRVVEESAKLAV